MTARERELQTVLGKRDEHRRATEIKAEEPCAITY